VPEEKKFDVADYLPFTSVTTAIGFAVAVLAVIAVAKMLPLPKVIRP
jgi:type IV secretory pathway component VirB8